MMRHIWRDLEHELSLQHDLLNEQQHLMRFAEISFSKYKRSSRDTCCHKNLYICWVK